MNCEIEKEDYLLPNQKCVKLKLIKTLETYNSWIVEIPKSLSPTAYFYV